jgi:hypothetical protein
MLRRNTEYSGAGMPDYGHDRTVSVRSVLTIVTAL